MACEITFLAVGNADSIVIFPDADPAIVVDLPLPRAVTDCLLLRGRLSIGCLLVTHAHRDHFVSLTKFVSFLEQWHAKGGSVERVVAGLEVFTDAFAELRTLDPSSAAYKRLRHTLDSLSSLRKGSMLFTDEGRNITPTYKRGKLEITIIHPETIFFADHRSRFPRRHNERSLVLRIGYGDFAAILLADLEGEGISECLDTCAEEELRATLVKFPHHGAWTKNGPELEKLLRKIDAELAVLSVGSTNTYGHVVPETFRMLLGLVKDPTARLRSFLCTEVTRTCTHSATHRAGMSRKGLASRLPCAGNIVISGDETGHLEISAPSPADHAKTIGSLKYAACEGRADI